MTPGDQPRPAPFVGPRPYKIGEKLFGRDRERLELLDLLIAERIVLLYSPSGAGKTSLVQAALVPGLRNEAFTVPAVARVTFEQATGLSELAANRYVFAVLLSLEEGQPKERQFPLDALARKTLPGYLDERWTETAGSGGMVLILDQFEEILTIDPIDVEAKKEFFAQLGAALSSQYRWALLSMREEHVAGLDPYRSMIPTRLASTFRLELLNEQQARQTMQEASAQTGVPPGSSPMTFAAFASSGQAVRSRSSSARPSSRRSFRSSACGCGASWRPTRRRLRKAMSRRSAAPIRPWPTTTLRPSRAWEAASGSCATGSKMS